MTRCISWLLVFGVLIGAAPASAGIVRAAGSTWEYTFTDPTSNAIWNNVVGGWTTGPAPFGNNSGGYGSDPLGYFDYATLWPASTEDGDDLWVRTAVDFSGFDLSTAAWDLGVDNGFKLYLNGSLVYSHSSAEYTYRWEYSGTFSPTPGGNIVAVALEDNGGLTAFDMQITAEVVPEPTTPIIWSLLGALGITVGWRRRR